MMIYNYHAEDISIVIITEFMVKNRNYEHTVGDTVILVVWWWWC